MRAAFLESEGHLVLRDAEMPRIKAPDEILIQVKTVGICGSEVHAFAGTHPYRKPPVILGHEAAGIVTEVGAEVTHFKAGDRVVVDPQWTCGECPQCRAGHINLCPSKRVLGTPGWPGAFGEYIVVPEEAAFSLPDQLSFAQGSMIEPLTVAVHVSQRAGLVSGESVAVLGTGSIGGLLVGTCSAKGADPVIAVDIRQHCLDAARECFGATHDFLLPDPALVEKIRELTTGEGVDVVFVTADDPSLVSLGIEMTKRRGRIVLVALMTEAPLQLRTFDILQKEISIMGSLMANYEDVQRAIDLAASRKVAVEGIISHVLPIEDAQRGMRLAQTKDDSAIKVVLSFDNA